MTQPSVFALPPSAAYAAGFARGVHARFGTDPTLLGRTQVLVNTRRSRLMIEEALAAAAAASAMLPRVAILSELYEDPLEAPGTAPAVPTLRRSLRLARLIEGFLTTTSARGGARPPLSAAMDLALSLTRLWDQFHDEDVDPGRLDHLLSASGLAEDAARHWQETLAFIDIVRKAWPDILREEESGALDPKDRQRAVISDRLTRWQSDPPDHPVIVAASTGSIGSTADLMAGIAKLPRGMVVLPGFDPAIPMDIWDNAGPDHPLGPFRGLLDRLEMTPSDVLAWEEARAPSARQTLLTQALRPAPVTDHWHGALPELARILPEATRGMSLIEAANPGREADAITVAIREALESPERTVALVTPDAALARRVTAGLSALDIIPDDSLGRPLDQTPPGILMRLVLDVAGGCDAVRHAAFLTHPLVMPGMERAAHLRHARHYIDAALRPIGAATGALPAWPEADADQNAWLHRLHAALAPLTAALGTGADLAGIVTAHRQALETLTTPPDAPPEIWKGTAGQALHGFIDQLARHADAYAAPPPSYAAMLDSLAANHQVRTEPGQVHPRVFIWGTAEARVGHADLMILGGLNDGVWPALPGADPWLSRPMRAALGLPLPEREIGLAAHDFVMAACKADVILTRAKKVDGVPTVPSRWLVRLNRLIAGIDAQTLSAMTERGSRLLDLSAHLRQPVHTTAAAPRPDPRPPVDARPRDLSATELELLIRDAYAIYARRVLRLPVREPLGRAPDYRERGTVVHKVLERFVEDTRAWPGPETARLRLIDIGDAELHRLIDEPDLRRIWRARIARFADWFVERETLRRQSATPAKPEIKGAMTLSLTGGNFDLIAKADRIDLTPDGAMVYDYKTGTPPSRDTIEAGFAHQLHLQAAILADGGFPGLGRHRATGGAYIGLTGSGDGGQEVEVDFAEGLDTYLARLTALLDSYDNPATGYLSLGRPQRAADRGDYDHLARRAEWFDTEDGQ